MTTTSTATDLNIRRKLLALLATLGILFAVAPATAQADPGKTVVSFTFDDGWADQDQGLDVLLEHDMSGTLYINSGRLGDQFYTTAKTLHEYADKGIEIAGHTLDHPDLAKIDAVQAKHEICDDRAALLGMGFKVTNFAYPFGSLNSTAKKVVEGCGYNSARALPGLRSPGFGCLQCYPSETIPPRDQFEIKAPTTVRTETTLDILKADVTQAYPSGGWVPLIFHHICDDECAPNAISLKVFTQFVEWLSQEQNVTVKTVNQVIGGDMKPAVKTAAFMADPNKDNPSPTPSVAPVSASTQPPSSSTSATAFTVAGIPVGQPQLIFIGILVALTAMITFRIASRGKQHVQQHNEF